MILGGVLILFGILIIVINPLLGSIPGALLILLGVVAVVFGVLARGAGAVFGTGNKTCPDCRSRIPRRAAVCRFCGYRYPAE